MSRRAEVVAWLAELLERPESDLHDDFDVVSDHDWSQADPDDYGFVFEDLIRRFGIHDQRFDFGRHYRGPRLWRPFAWYWWRVFRYPAVVIERMTVADMVRMADSGVWDRSVEPQSGTSAPTA